MFNKIGVFPFVVILCFTIRVETTFVSVGNYSQYSDYGINSPDCGLRLAPDVHEIEFNDNCFMNNYPNITYRQFIKENDNTFSEDPIQSRVMYGKDVQTGESPWTVLLHQSLWGVGWVQCSGVLITFEWVLTAAHCELTFDINRITVYAGSNIRKKGEYIEVNQGKFFKHPNYDNTSLHELLRQSNDIALVKVKSKFKQVRDGAVFTINTACLPGREQWNRRNGQKATFYGWGLSESNFFREWPDNLRKGDVELHTHLQCKTTIVLCVHFWPGYNGPRGCPGDSGGPLVQFVEKDKVRRAVLIGTMQGGTPVVEEQNWYKQDCRKEVFNKDNMWIAVSRSEVLDWIFKTIREN